MENKGDNMFDTAKFSRLVIENDKYLIQIEPSGVCITRMNGNGDEKDRDVELTWDEIYQLKDGYTVKG
jgi:hypothetical protein